MTKYGLGWFLGMCRKVLDHLSQKYFFCLVSETFHPNPLCHGVVFQLEPIISIFKGEVTYTSDIWRCIVDFLPALFTLVPAPARTLRQSRHRYSQIVMHLCIFSLVHSYPMLSLGTDTVTDIGLSLALSPSLCLHSHFPQFPFLVFAEMQFLLRAMQTNYVVAMSLRGRIRLFAWRGMTSA